MKQSSDSAALPSPQPETWHFNEEQGRIENAKGRIIAFIAHGHSRQSVKDANVLAAAHDMLEALEGLYPLCHDSDMAGESPFELAWLKAEAALRKANPGTP